MIVEVIQLPLGERPDDDTDCIKIEELTDGRFGLTGTVLCHLSGEDADSVSLVETDYFDRISKAEEAGIVWANAQGVQTLYVGYGTLARPIEQTDVDGPL
jgi:hypothetical protein